MAYEPTVWKNREVEHPRRFMLQNNGDGTTTLNPAEGQVTEPGTPIMATNMNKIEQGIANAIPSEEKGTPNGVASLNAAGKIPSTQLGVIVVDASTTQKGIVQLINSFTSTSNTLAPTANALKLVNDKLISNQINLGYGATALPQEAIAIGPSAIVAAGAGIAIGAASNTSGINGISLGYGAKANHNNSVAIGFGVSADMGSDAKLGVATSGYGPWNWLIPGQLYVSGTKNFQMAHPQPDKKATHVIRHGAVESPTTGDTLYRYAVEATEPNQVVEITLPDYFEHLNINVDVWVNPHLHFGRAFGVVEGDKLKVTCETAGVYKALVIGTRNDDDVQDWYIKGVEREIGETWLGETYEFEVTEFTEITEYKEEIQ